MTQQPPRNETLAPGIPETLRKLLLLAVPPFAFALVFVSLREPILLVLAAAAVPAYMLLRNTDWATLLVIFMIYLNVPGIAVQFHGVPKFVAAAVVLLFGLPLMTYLVVRRERLIVAQPLPLILAFLGVQFLGALFSDYPDEAMINLATFVFEGLLIFLIITNLVRDRRMLRRSVWAILLAGLVIGSIGVFQQVTDTHDNEYAGFAQSDGSKFRTGEDAIEGVKRQRRAAGAIGEKNSHSQMMFLLVPIGFFVIWGEKRPAFRLLAAAATLFAGLGGILAFSRSAAVAFVATIVLALVMRYLNRKHVMAMLLGGALMLIIMPQYLTRLVTLDKVLSMISGDQGASQVDDGAIRGRATEMWAAALVFADHPVVGVGPMMFRYYAQEYAERVGIKALGGKREAHSFYLALAADHGVLGLGCVFAILWVVFRGLHRGRRLWLRHDPQLALLCTGLFLGIGYYLLMGVFLHLAYIRYFWLLLALGSAAGQIAARRAAEWEESETRRLALHS